MDIDDFASGAEPSVEVAEPEGFVDMDEFAPKIRPVSARIEEEEAKRQEEAAGETSARDTLEQGYEEVENWRMDPLGFMRSQPDSDPSFLRDVVMETVADAARLPSMAGKGLATAPRHFFAAQEAFTEAHQRTRAKRIQEYKDPSYVPEMAKKKYPITDDMSEEEIQENLRKRKIEAEATKRRFEARGGVEGAQEDIERLQESALRAKKWKERFPERHKEFKNLAEAAFFSIGEFAPGMAALMGSGGLAGFLTNYTSMHGMMYEQYLQAGAAKDKAHEAAQIAATLSGLIETGGTALTFGAVSKIMGKMLPKIGASPNKVALAREVMKSAGTVAKPGAIEGIEEGVQAYPEEFGMVLATASDEDTPEDVRKRFYERIQSEEFKQGQARGIGTGFVSGLTMGVVPATGKALTQRAQKRRETVRKKNRAKARAARTKLQDAYQRKAGDQGLKSVHPLAQHNLDLYNMLHQPKGSIFDQMEAKAIAKGLREAKVLKQAEEIKARRGEKKPEAAEETVEQTEETVEQPRRASEEEIDELAEEMYGEPEQEVEAAPEEPAEPAPEEEGSLVERYRRTRQAEQAAEPEAEETAEPEQEVQAEPSDKISPKESADILTKKGEAFKTFRAAKSSMTRQGLSETHDVVTREDGYAIRPKAEAVAQTAEETQVEEETSTFDDIELLQSELRRIEEGDSIVNTGDVSGALETLQENALATLAGMDTADQKITFIAGNNNLTESENDKLSEIFQKEDAGTLTNEDAAVGNVLMQKLVGREPKNRADQEYESREAPNEEDENLFDLPSFFDTDPEAVETIMNAYSQRSIEQIKQNPETLLGYLANQLNAWVHGIAEPDIQSIKETLNFLRDESDGMYEYFGNQSQLNEFVESLDNAIELAEKAPSLKSGTSGITLRVSFGLDLFYPAAKDTISQITKWRGKVNAKTAWNMLKKNVSESDLEYLGVNRMLARAAHEGKSLTKEEVLENMIDLPQVKVSFNPSSSGEIGGALRQIYHLKQMYSEGAVQESDFAAPELDIEAAANAIGIDYDTVAKYITGEVPLTYLFDKLSDQHVYPGNASFEVYSVFTDRKPDQYEYEDMTITLPDHAYDPDDAYHSAFGAPIAFFARTVRSKDKFIVEEIQSELATILGKKHKDIPSPYKQKAWVDLVTTMIAKRARALGYKEVYFPTYKWVNTRWMGHLPVSTKPIYDKMIPKAMGRIDAVDMGMEEVEEGVVTIANEETKDLLTDMDKYAWGIVNSARGVEEALEDAGKNRQEFYNDVLTHYRKVLLEQETSPLIDFLENAEVFLGKKSAPARALRNFLDTGDVSQIGNKLITIGALMNADSLDLLNVYAAFAEGSPFNTNKNVYEALNELSGMYDLFLHTDGSLPQNIGKRVESLHEHLFSDNAAKTSEDLIDKVMMDTITWASEPVVEFHKFRLSSSEPGPASISLSCKCGIDPTDIVRLAKRFAKRRGEKAPKKGKGEAVREMYDQTEAEMEKSLSRQAATIRNYLGSKLLDVTRPVKQKLVNTFGEQAANRAITRIILAKGYSVRSSMFLNRAMKDTFGGLSNRKRNVLNRIIFSSRLVQIGRYRGNIKDFKGRTPQEHRDYLYNVEEIEGVTEGEALELFRRAERYFDYTLELLDILHEEKLVTDEEYEELKTFRWTRTEALGKIDPKITGGISSMGQTAGRLGKTSASVRESGVEELEMGSELDTPQTDMMYTLADWTNRVMKRASLARLNKEVWDLANSQPDNQLLRPAKGNKRPQNWKTIEMMVDGKKRKLYAPETFTRWWLLDDISVKQWEASMLRTLSGSAILRPMATGVRIGFIPVNLLRDLQLIWQATKYMGDDGKWKPVYNRLMPVAAGQMLWDIGKVTPAAIMKERHKKYQDFINAGGGLSFLAIQGRPLEAKEMRTRFGSRTSQEWAKLNNFGDRVFDVLKYPLEVSEIVTRLMTVERSLSRIAQREGVSVSEARADKKMYAEATGIAKDYLDFSQYGSAVKTLDHMFPYLNATFQAGRSNVRAWRKDWKTAAFQHAQVMTLGMLLALGRAGYMKDDEDEDRDIEKDISAYDLARNFIIFPFGKELYFTDEFGNKHRPYIKIPVEGTLMLAKTLGEIAVARMTKREIRGDVISEAVRGSIPFQAAPTDVPIASAYMKYFLNVDPYFGGKVWPYDEYIKAEERIMPDTPEMIKDFSEAMNEELPEGSKISPHNLHQALTSLGTNGNYLTHFFGTAYNSLRDVPEADRELILWKALAEHPTTGGVINFTRPDTAMMEEIESSEADVVTEQHKSKYTITQESKELRAMKRGMVKGNARRKERKILKQIEEFAGDDTDEYNRLYDIYRFYTEMPDTPRWNQWQRLAGKTPETRAKMFKRILDQTPPGKREDVWEEVRTFPQVDSDDFWRAYNRIIDSE